LSARASSVGACGNAPSHTGGSHYDRVTFITARLGGLGIAPSALS
jgi:hypothetical protein